MPLSPKKSKGAMEHMFLTPFSFAILLAYFPSTFVLAGNSFLII